MGLPTLSALQERAVKAACGWYTDHEHPLFYLAGYAGSGKSTIMPVIIDALGINPDEVEFCAPTGKAAKVMTTKLKAFGIDRRARTIHSLIYRPKPLRADMLERSLEDLRAQRSRVIEDLEGDPNWERHPKVVEIDKSMALIDADLEKLFDQGEDPKFQLNPDSDIRKSRICVVDEASMVGEMLAGDLLGFDVPVLAMGDPGQLPPVKDNEGLTAETPDFFLDEIHRQAKDNPIIHLATMAREGRSLKVGKYGDGVEVVDRMNDKATYNPELDAQIIVGTNSRRWMVTKKLRKALGFNSTGPCAGEPLIVCKNSRSVPDMVNGAFVNCVHDVGDLRDGTVAIKVLVEDEFGVQRPVMALQGLFEEHRLGKKGAATAPAKLVYRARIENEHLDWGWAITCHKSQGSEWDNVVLHDESGTFREDADKWLYTGITRAAKGLTVVL